MSRCVDFYFDVGSPASYLAWTQLPDMARSLDARINWKPILLGGLFQATGNQSPAANPAKGQYLFTDLSRYAARYGAEFTLNPYFPINTLRLMRGAAGLLGSADFEAYLNAVYPALWSEGKNLGDADVLNEVLRKAGIDPAENDALCGSEEVKERLKSLTGEAVSRGAFGAPTFFVGDEMYFGQDRLEWVAAALEKQ